LDKELAASGFTRKEQVEMEKVFCKLFIHAYIYRLFFWFSSLILYFLANLQYIEEDAEGSDDDDDDDDDKDEVGDAVPLVSLKIDQVDLPSKLI
jgi:RIO kinase 2